MKYVMLIYQGSTPLPGSEEGAELSEEEQRQIYADYGAQTPTDDRFSEYRIGVDHLALAIGDRGELDSLVDRLRGAGVQTAGVETDPVLNKEYVAFRDPDNVQLEAYMA